MRQGPQSSFEIINFSNIIQVTSSHLCYTAVMTNCQLYFEIVTKSCCCISFQLKKNNTKISTQSGKNK